MWRIFSISHLPFITSYSCPTANHISRKKNILLFYKSAQICYYWRSENANLGWRRLKRNFIFHGLLKWPIWWFDNGDKQFKNESHPDRNIVIKKQQEMQRLKMQIFKFYTGGHYHYYYHHNIRRSLVIWYCDMVKVLSSHISQQRRSDYVQIYVYMINHDWKTPTPKVKYHETETSESALLVLAQGCRSM